MDPSSRRLMRAGLALLSFVPAWIGIWATVAPRSFYDHFPGWSSWVSSLGPYDEHLVRDIGAFQLGLLVVGLFALVTLERRVVRAALVASLVAGVPHLVYHPTPPRPPSPAEQRPPLPGVAVAGLLPPLLFPRTPPPP